MSDIIYPVRFTDNTCCKCGAKNSVKYEQFRDGKLYSSMPIYDISSFTCERCGTRYFLQWDYNEDQDTFLPIITNTKKIKEFSSSIFNLHGDNERDIDVFV